MTRSTDTRVVRVRREDLLKLEVFIKRDAAQAQPGNSDAPQAFVQGLRSSLERFDFLASDSHWLLAAEVDGQYVGYLNVVRIHKADARIGVLYVDELMVLKEFRRRGIASALWQEVQRLATELGVWRVRVTVNPDNQGARAFYRSVGLQERPLILCEQEPETLALDVA